jgi:hypothetical protein
MSQFTKEQQDAIAKTTELWRDMSSQLNPTIPQIDTGGMYGPTMAAAIAKSGNKINNYNMPITLEGAITNDDIQNLLQKIDEKIKSQPNYIGNRDFVTEVENDEVKKNRLAKVLSPKI